MLSSPIFQMESQNADEEDQFFDALDDFPFYDCLAFDESDSSTSDLPSTIRHRVFSRRGISSKEPGDLLPEASTIEDHSKTNLREPRSKFYRDVKTNDHTFEITESTRDGLNSNRVIEEKSDVESTVTTARNDELVDRARNSADLGAELMLSSCYMFIIDPFQALRNGRAYIITKLLNIWNSICGYFSPLMYEWLKDFNSIWNLVFRFGWGMFWATYVGCVLCGLLFTSLVISGVLMRYLVEEPLKIKEMLNFDFTKSSPVAFVPVVSCAAVGCGMKCMEKIDVGKNVGSRVIPPDHKLQVTVSLTLPESEYNRNLGMFQVRVDFLSVNGETLASSSHPCMLKFKSEPIRILLTFFKVTPLITGYVSEAQTLNLKIRGLNEGIVPTACLRVVLEQRAEYRPGAGIPELYDASLILDSELPFIKRIIWYWKKTIFIWVSLTSFMMELLFALVCCRPILIPRTRTRDGSASSSSTQNRLQAQI
ncbi:seipin-2-like isoform X2 [Durio zibethinus]|uniref:Seipin-2-like isoform X2 n=1 Tax=Durio zibethinus TaxID=66656 RepID=A0A6P5WIF6_DURZI|nr:seipin-2-like isoform X2 [Durio zibethinus]